MKKFLALLLAATGLHAQPVLTTTPFTRNMLRSNDAAGVRAHIGVNTTNAGLFYIGVSAGSTNADVWHVYSNTVSGTHAFKSLGRGTNITLIGSNGIIFVHGQAWSGENLGVSNAVRKGLYYDTSNRVHRFYSLEAGTNVILFMTETSVVVNAASAGGGGSSDFLGVKFGSGDTNGYTNLNLVTNGIVFISEIGLSYAASNAYPGQTVLWEYDPLYPTNVAGWLPINTATNAGLVYPGYLASGAKVWKTDSSGNPAWREDATGGGGSATNVITDNVIYVREDGDDSTAVRGSFSLAYASLTNAITNLQSGDTLLIYPGNYTVNLFDTTNDATLSISSKTNVAVIGVGWPRILANNLARGRLFEIYDCRNVLIQGLEMVGSTNRPGDPGISLAFAINLDGTNHNVTIQNNRFFNWARFGVAHLEPTTTYDRFIAVRNNYFYYIGSTNLSGLVPMDGAAVVASSTDWDISGNFMENCMRGVEIYSGPWGVPLTDIAVHHNQIMGPQGSGIILFNEYTDASAMARIQIQDNIIRGWITNICRTDHMGIQILNGADVDISRNLLDNFETDYGAISIASSVPGCGRFMVAQNTMRNVHECVAMRIQTATTNCAPAAGVNILNNIIDTIDYGGMDIQANDVLIANNVILNVSTNTGDGAGDHSAIYCTSFIDTNNVRPCTNIVIRGNIIGQFGANLGVNAVKVASKIYNVVLDGNVLQGAFTPLLHTTNGQIRPGPTTNDLLALPIIGSGFDAETVWIPGYSSQSNQNVRIPGNYLGSTNTGSSSSTNFVQLRVTNQIAMGSAASPYATLNTYIPNVLNVMNSNGTTWGGLSFGLPSDGGPVLQPLSATVLQVLDTLLTSKAALDVGGFTNTGATRITTGAGANKVLTSDADGDATWEDAPAGNVSGEQGMLQMNLLNIFAGTTNLVWDHRPSGTGQVLQVPNLVVTGTIQVSNTTSASSLELYGTNQGKLTLAVPDTFPLTNTWYLPTNSMTQGHVLTLGSNGHSYWAENASSGGGLAAGGSITNITAYGLRHPARTVSNFTGTIDLAWSNNYCYVELTADSGLTVSNLAAGRMATVLLRNTATGSVVVTVSSNYARFPTNRTTFTLLPSRLGVASFYSQDDQATNVWCMFNDGGMVLDNIVTTTLTVSDEGFVSNLDVTNLVVDGKVTIAAADTNAFAWIASNRTITNAPDIYEYLYVPAGSMLSLSNAATGTLSNGIAAKRDTLDFDDTANESATFNTTLGDGWNLGTLKAKFHFTCATTNINTTNVVWAIRASQGTNGVLLGVTNASFVYSTNVGPMVVNNELIVSAATPALTVAGTLTKGMPVDFEVMRLGSGGADNKSGDARLLAVEIQYGVRISRSTAW